MQFPSASKKKKKKKQKKTHKTLKHCREKKDVRKWRLADFPITCL